MTAAIITKPIVRDKTYVTPEMFPGADDSTRMTAAITEAISSGRTLLLQSGTTYTLSSFDTYLMTVGEKLRIRGQGADKPLIIGKGRTGGATADFLYCPSDTVVDIDGIEFRSFRRVVDFPTGSFGASLTFTNNVVSDVDRVTETATSNCALKKFHIIRNEIFDFLIAGIRNQAVDGCDCLVDGNYIHDGERRGIEVGTIDAYSVGMRIVNNKVVRVKRTDGVDSMWGILVNNGGESIVSNNYLDECRVEDGTSYADSHGMYVQSLDGFSISGNVVINCGHQQAAICAKAGGSHASTITGNTVYWDELSWKDTIEVTYTNATNLINATGHGFQNGDRVFLSAKRNNPMAVPTGLSRGVLYYVVNALTDSFQVSLTSGGAAETFTDDGTTSQFASRVDQSIPNPGVGIFTTSQNCNITGNTIVNQHGHAARGIWFADAGTDAVISSNLISGLTDVNTSPRGIYLVTNGRTKVIGNKIRKFENNGFNRVSYGIDLSNGGEDITLENNTLEYLTAASTIVRSIALNSSAIPYRNITIKGNTFRGTMERAIYQNGDCEVDGLFIENNEFDFTDSLFNGTSFGLSLRYRIVGLHILRNTFRGLGSAVDAGNNSEYIQVGPGGSVLTVTADNATNTFTSVDDHETPTPTPHGLSDGLRIKIYSSIAIPNGISTPTSYWVVNSDATTFQVSLTEGGAAVAFSDDGDEVFAREPVPDDVTYDGNLFLDSANNRFLDMAQTSPAAVGWTITNNTFKVGPGDVMSTSTTETQVDWVIANNTVVNVAGSFVTNPSPGITIVNNVVNNVSDLLDGDNNWTGFNKQEPYDLGAEPASDDVLFGAGGPGSTGERKFSLSTVIPSFDIGSADNNLSEGQYIVYNIWISGSGDITNWTANTRPVDGTAPTLSAGYNRVVIVGYDSDFAGTINGRFV